MRFTDILGVIGGLSLFLYGMKMMSDGLALVAGSRLKEILEKLTRNRYVGVLVGIVIAAIIQSSNATTVMAVGFVNAGLMDLSQAVGVIIGAKVGTTMTGQLLTLKADQIAPLVAMIGVTMIMFFKKKKVNHLGQVVGGLGILFLGMNMMSSSMSPLKDVVWFRNLIIQLENPIFGVLVGTLFTALIQSSSASVGILQAMAAQNVLTLGQAAPLVYGMNMGACVSAVLSSIGGKKDAKRASLLAILFSTIGAAIFITAGIFIPFPDWVASLTPDNPMRQVANLPTLFNLFSMLLILPFSNLLVKLSQKIVPGEDVQEDELKLVHIDEHAFGAASIGIAQVDAEVSRMHALARTNLEMAGAALLNQDPSNLDLINKNEETVDFLNKEITRCLVRINRLELTTSDAQRLSSMYHVVSDIERIGDHAQNIAEYSATCKERNASFSEEGKAELSNLMERTLKILDNAYEYFMNRSSHMMEDIENQEQAIDDLVDECTQNHIDRLNANLCDADSGLIFSEVLTDLERVSDHALNIAEAAVYHV